MTIYCNTGGIIERTKVKVHDTQTSNCGTMYLCYAELYVTSGFGGYGRDDLTTDQHKDLINQVAQRVILKADNHGINLIMTTTPNPYKCDNDGDARSDVAVHIYDVMKAIQKDDRFTGHNREFYNKNSGNTNYVMMAFRKEQGDDDE